MQQLSSFSPLPSRICINPCKIRPRNILRLPCLTSNLKNAKKHSPVAWDLVFILKMRKKIHRGSQSDCDRVRTCESTYLVITSPTRYLWASDCRWRNHHKSLPFALTLLMYIIAGPDPNPSGGGQLPNPNECNFTLTSATREETLTPNPNECNSTLTSGTSGGSPT